MAQIGVKVLIINKRVATREREIRSFHSSAHEAIELRQSESCLVEITHGESESESKSHYEVEVPFKRIPEVSK